MVIPLGNAITFYFILLTHHLIIGKPLEVNKIKASFANLSQRSKFAPGIAFKANNIDLSPSDIIKCIQLNRSSGLAGQVFFFYEGLIKNNNEIAIALRTQGDYNQQASLPFSVMA